ncbi:glycosyl hydrolase family 95 catalytic domain-containing protein [Subtercola endophyticus]|uniref:glycosyl hydrolase family 95 catalytic domain-containing protein n=1 Tax=Subtercola endophyticus TaxID=2895559 RepID=UPI001E414478|nr:glycoside hydrolase N-terminal domain-containing protein [Subtercola endophyticus]UFS58724.1 glycoside hydrolase family 95 protein [Subtercola endophyticus]
MAHRYRIALSSPAELFVDSFLLGNGSTGAAVYGTPRQERFDLNADTLWSGGPTNPSNSGNGAARLASTRAAIARCDYRAADAAAVDLQSDGWTQSYQPVGGLLWDYASDGVAPGADYQRVLNVADAISTTQYSTAVGLVSLESFVSAPDGVLVATVSGASASWSPPSFDSPHLHTEITHRMDGGAHLMTVTGRAPASVLPNYIDEPDAVRYATDPPDADGLVDAGMGFAVCVIVERVNDGETRLIAAVETGYRGYDERPSAALDDLAARAFERVARARERSIDELRERHSSEYRQLFDRVDLDLSTSKTAAAAQAELFFHFGRYLLISSSRPGTVAANLQGIWNVDVRPGWSSNFTTNINTQMNYWGAELTGLSDLHEPLLELIHDLAVRGTDSAMEYYGLNGATTHHNTDIWRWSAPVAGRPQWSNWPSALLWLCAHTWDNLAFETKAPAADARTLETFEAIIRFALGMLVSTDDRGMVFSPSTSPEHPFTVGGVTASVTAGSAMDQELVYELFTHYLALASATPEADPALVERVRLTLPGVAPARIGSDGTLLEWGDGGLVPSEPGHRHLSHLYGLFPGTRITEIETPDDFEAARRSLRARLEHGSGYTGWSQAWILCLAARLRDADLAERSIDTLLTKLSSASLLDLHPHPDWPGGQIFQIDGNLGAIAGIAELIVQSHDGTISVLKAIPKSWPTGSIHGIRARGGNEVDVQWADHELVSVVVRTRHDGPLILDLPATIEPIVVSDALEGAVAATPLLAPPGRRRVSWLASAGDSYRLEPQV